MIWFVSFILLSFILAGVLSMYRSWDSWGWDIFDGTVLAALIITGVAEQAWWFGLIKQILEYSNA